MTDSILLFGAGIDSTVLLADLMKHGRDPELVFVQDSPNEVLTFAARKVAAHYAVPLNIFNFSEVANLRKIVATEANFYIPGYKVFIFLPGLAYADKMEIETVYAGNMIEGAIGYEDLLGKKVIDDTMEGWNWIIEMYNHLYSTDIRLVNPYLTFKRKEIVRLGKKLKVPFELTCSCPKATQELDKSIVHCGECFNCLLRKKSFKSARIKDPSRYRI